MWNFVSDDMKLIQPSSDASKATMHGQANKGSILVVVTFARKFTECIMYPEGEKKARLCNRERRTKKEGRILQMETLGCKQVRKQEDCAIDRKAII